MPNHTIIGYDLRVAVLYQDRVNFDLKPYSRTWREVSYSVGPEYGGGANCLSEEHQWNVVAMNAKACAAVLDRHEKDEHGVPMWKGMEAIGATVLGFGAVIEPASQTDAEVK